MIVVGKINLKHVRSSKSANVADSMKELKFWKWNFQVHLNREEQVPVHFKTSLSKFESI